MSPNEKQKKIRTKGIDSEKTESEDHSSNDEDKHHCTVHKKIPKIMNKPITVERKKG